MLQSSMPQNQIKGIRKSLNIASMHQMGEKIKNKSFMPPLASNSNIGNIF